MIPICTQRHAISSCPHTHTQTETHKTYVPGLASSYPCHQSSPSTPPPATPWPEVAVLNLEVELILAGPLIKSWRVFKSGKCYHFGSITSGEGSRTWGNEFESASTGSQTHWGWPLEKGGIFFWGGGEWPLRRWTGTATSRRFVRGFNNKIWQK